MNNNDSNRLNMRTQNGIAINPTPVGYSSRTQVFSPSPEASSDTESLTFAQMLSYYYSEYFKGLLFVGLSMLYIYVVPQALSRPKGLRLALGRTMKRLTDIVGSIIGLLVTSPLWLIIPILIKLDSSGPVFYTQTRVGINRRNGSRRFCQKADVPNRRSRDRRRNDYCGQTFRVIKFRTMVDGAEKTSGPVWATPGDSRVTRLGLFLRLSRIDEIPQFLNVLLGNMSLVGPRPERPGFVSDLSTKIPRYKERLNVKPGITGLAQIEHGYDSSINSVAGKIAYDLDYIKSWSLTKDFVIMVKTVGVVFTGKGAC